MVNDRWVEVTPSQFPHEADGLRIIRDLMPKNAPYRAWTNFEFRDGRGTWSEVDLLLLAPDGLHLIELKHYAGVLRGNDNVWLRSGRPAEDSPLLLANRKAKRLSSRLSMAFAEHKRKHPNKKFPPTSDVIPWVQEAVFLHNPELRCELPLASRRDLYGLPGDAESGLVGIDAIFNRPPRQGTKIYDNAIAGLMKMIGVRAHQREAGSYVLDQAPLEDGPGWQDWLGTHKLLKDQRRRIRFHSAPEGSSDQQRELVKQIAAHELKVMQRLSLDGILRPEDFVDSELGPGLVYPYDPSWQRLDLWLEANPKKLGYDAQLALIRTLGETIQYAHGKHIVHRSINPRAVLVRPGRDGHLDSQLTGWQAVGRTEGATRTATIGVTRLAPSDAAGLPDADRWAIEAFTAPEGLVGAPDRLRLDVFALGALAFYLVTGQPPAPNRTDLNNRLRQQNGIDLWVELPQAPRPLRDAILQATRPQVTERFAGVEGFLDALAAAATPQTAELPDPLDAGAGAVLDGRFTVLKRLGAGSTAVGLLVNDAQRDQKELVLKVALDDAAAQRLADEASALASIDHRRIVKLIEGPIEVTGRQALLLESAGRETLTSQLGDRERIPLDFLERWGTDVLEAVVAIDSAGVMHRDIKPANLGVAEDRTAKGGRIKRLTLFDFSLSHTAASDTRAGTPPYLDPFVADRKQYDSAAERYSAAVVLFEMATGQVPVFGDGLSDPSVLDVEATINPDAFDRSVRASLVPFFTKALARDAKQRHNTAQEMLQQWRSSFPDSSVVPSDADELAEQATADTPLAEAGLSPRALSAIEQLGARSVGELAAIDKVELNSLPKVSIGTRREITARVTQWRERLGIKPRGSAPFAPRALPDPLDCAELFLIAARHGAKRKADRAVSIASQLLGVLGNLPANASHADLAALPPAVTRARIGQLLDDLQRRWAADETTLTLLNQFEAIISQRLIERGGVATFDELARHLLDSLTSTPGQNDGLRIAEGLLRLTMDRQTSLTRIDRAEPEQAADTDAWTLRRREGQPMLLALRPELLDLAESLGRRADSLVDETNITGTDQIVPAARATEKLLAVVQEAAAQLPTPVSAGLRDGKRLAELAASLSRRAGASSLGELHHRNLSAETALRASLPTQASGELIDTEELRSRVAHRFPMLAALPRRPQLTTLVHATGLLRWDEAVRKYRVTADIPPSDTDVSTRVGTVLPQQLAAAIGPGAVGQRLIDSQSRRSFVAFGVPADRLNRFSELVGARFQAVELNLTSAVLDALHAQAAEVGIPWSEVLGADAGEPGSRAKQGLRALMTRALPKVAALIEQTVQDAAGHPVLLTDPSLLARYDAIDLLSRWSDLATPRTSAVWLVLPQLVGNTGAVIDGIAFPLTAPSQYVEVGAEWINSQLEVAEPSAP